MEKFRIALYGMTQVTAIVYGVLVTGALAKFFNPLADKGINMPNGYYAAVFFRDYGFYLFVLVIAWASVISFLVSPWSESQIDEEAITKSGMAMTFILCVLSTGFVIGGLMGGGQIIIHK